MENKVNSLCEQRPQAVEPKMEGKGRKDYFDSWLFCPLGFFSGPEGLYETWKHPHFGNETRTCRRLCQPFDTGPTGALERVGHKKGWEKREEGEEGEERERKRKEEWPCR
jgi:hypothetical protein